ncbi:MAG: hypothetical protein MUF54_08640 [Polyangiaceae bacterium]|jgi:hypothetical protein|nr:hypothetical protein [Polyangiaceae bacterium]
MATTRAPGTPACSILLLVSLAAAIVTPIACGKPEIVVPFDSFGPTGDAGLDGTPAPDGSTFDVPTADTEPDEQGFEIRPPNHVIDPVQPNDVVQYQAVSIASGEPVDVSFWYVDKLVAGTIDSTGKFTATGIAGGEIVIGARTAKHHATATLSLRVRVPNDNVGGLDQTAVDALRAGAAGAADTNVRDTTFRWLYPYDQTVFPRGLLPPTLQLAGQGADAFRLHIMSKWYEYEGFFAGSNPERLAVPDSVWQGLTWSAGASDPVRVELTKLQGKDVTGPVVETWTIAQGSLKGLVYYNTYDDPLATQGGQLDEGRRGAVMRIRPGQRQPDVLLGGDGSCTVCHSVSANGQRMALSAGHTCNKAFDLSADGNAAEIYSDDCSDLGRHDDTFSFGGLTPDGTLMLTSASMQREPGGFEFFPNIASVDDDTGPRDSRLVDTATGQVVAAPGFDGVVHKALMPSFAPDTRRVAFVHFEAGRGNALSVMDFDPASRAFSNLQVVYDVTQYGIYDLFAGWPAFTPDSASVIYQVGDRRDYSTWRGGYGQLFIVDVQSRDERPLAILNGTRNGDSYVGQPEEAEMSFEPTVLPVAVGGYYWVVFTSRRSYGNMITEPGEGPDPVSEQHPSPKKLWVAAIDIGYRGGAPDPSHPAFYLEGQDLVSGNMRGFWALNPCKQVNESCESGSECCEGFCRAVEQDGATAYVCVTPPVDECSEEYEKCRVAADCCDVQDGYVCINGYCARPTPVK